MLRFLLKILCFAGLLIATVAGVYRAYVQRYPLSANYYAAVDDKERILATNVPPRFIAIGGSSVAFGIDAGLIGSQLRLHGVNMGVHISFGVPFFLAEVERHVRSNDVVVLALEYDSFSRSFEMEPELAATLLERNPFAIRRLPWRDAKRVLDRGMLMRIGRVLRAVLFDADETIYRRDNIYRRDAFNGHGDLTSHLDVPNAATAFVPCIFDPVEATKAIASVNEFHRRCQKRGARVFFLHPPFAESSFRESAEAVQQLEALLRRDLNVPMLDSPEDAVLPNDNFYDTGYHLNPKARTKRSLELAARLKSNLGLESTQP